jgi:hypothetical protein
MVTSSGARPRGCVDGDCGCCESGARCCVGRCIISISDCEIIDACVTVTAESDVGIGGGIVIGYILFWNSDGDGFGMVICFESDDLGEWDEPGGSVIYQ